MKLRPVLLALVLGGPFLGAPFLGAQEPPPPPSVPALLLKLRDPALDAWDRDDIVDQILAHGEAGAQQLFSFSSSQYRTRNKRLRRDIEQHLRAFAKTGPRVVRDKQGRRAEAKIDALRDGARDITRAPDLQKERIRTELDPILAELTAMVTVTAADVLAAKGSLDEQAHAIAAEVAALDELFQIHGVATRALQETATGRRFVDRHDPLPLPLDLAAEVERPRRFLAILATPMSARATKVMQANHEVRAELGPEEYEGILALNTMRLTLGRPPLRVDLALCAAGRGHSQDMSRLGFFSHTSPVKGKESPGKRAALAGTSGGAENIAAGQSTGRGAIRAWWYSPGHHKNMMGGHGRVGLGRHGRYWTQMFGG